MTGSAIFPLAGSTSATSTLSAILSLMEKDFLIFVGDAVKWEVKRGTFEGEADERVGLLLSIEVLREPEPG